jgi:hypothetical protein
MGPVNDDDDMATRKTAEVPVRSESPSEAGVVAQTGEAEAGAEERLAPGMEEAGYGYGV